MADHTYNSDGGSVASLATLALVSTYIADQRPEGDTLGKWAEIAQALSITFLILGLVIFVIGALLAFVMGD